MTFDTYGPFPLGRAGEHASRDAWNDFWDQVDEIELEEAIGVYVITVKHGTSVKPWYVGKTDEGFRKRLSSRAGLFASLALIAPKGQIEVILLARTYSKRKGLMRPSKSKRRLNSIDSLEQLLIGSCFSKNPKLLNIKRMNVYKKLKVPGYLNDGKGKLKASASSLRALLT